MNALQWIMHVDQRVYGSVLETDPCRRVHVDHVVVYNRRDCCSDRIDGVKVRFLSFYWKPSTIYNAHTVIQLYLYKSTLIRSPPFISPAQCVYLLTFCSLVVPLQHFDQVSPFYLTSAVCLSSRVL